MVKKGKLGQVCILLAWLGAVLSAQEWSGSESVGVEVNDPRGRPIENAKVMLTYSGQSGGVGPPLVATDARGRAVIDGLVLGQWQIEISHPDYLSYVGVLHMRPGKKAAVSTSFLEAAGTSLTPVKVKFFNAKNQAASPPIGDQRPDLPQLAAKTAQPAAPEPAPAAPAEIQEPPAPVVRSDQTPTTVTPPVGTYAQDEAEPEDRAEAVSRTAAPRAEPQREDEEPPPTPVSSPEPEPEPAVDVGPAPTPAVEIEPAPEPAAEVEPTPELPSQTPPEPEPEMQPEIPSRPTPEAEPEPQPEPASAPQVETLPAPQPSVETEPEPQPIPTPTPTPTPTVKAQPIPQPQVQPQPEAESIQPEAAQERSEPLASPPPLPEVPVPETIPEPTGEAEPESQPEPEAEPELASRTPDEAPMEPELPTLPEPAAEPSSSLAEEASESEPLAATEPDRSTAISAPESAAPQEPTAALPKVETAPAAEPTAALEPTRDQPDTSATTAPPAPLPTPETIAEPPVEAPRPDIVPAPPAGVIGIGSYRDNTCPDCEEGEWASANSKTVGAERGNETCDQELIDSVGSAMQGLGDSINLELAGYLGPVFSPSGNDALELLETDLAQPFSEGLQSHVDGSSSCQIVALVVPKAARYTKARYFAADRDSSRECSPGADCGLDKARWATSARVEKGYSATVVWALFENTARDRERRATLSVYFRPPNATWQPRTVGGQ